MADPLHASSPTCAQTLRALSRYPARTAFAWPGGSLSYQGATRPDRTHPERIHAPGLAARRARRIPHRQSRRHLVRRRRRAIVAGSAITWLHPLGSREDQLFQLEDFEAKCWWWMRPPSASAAASSRHRRGSSRRSSPWGRPTTAPICCRRSRARPRQRAVPRRPRRSCHAELHRRHNRQIQGRATPSPRKRRRSPGAILADFEIPERARYLTVAPISHVAGTKVLPTLMRGGTVHMLKGFDPEAVLATIARERINFTLFVPTMIYVLLDHPALGKTDLSSLELVLYGASAMSPSRLIEGIERIGPVFSQLYGQTECYPVSVLRKADHDPNRPELFLSCGFPIAACEVKILDDNDQEVEDGRSRRNLRARSTRHGGVLEAAGHHRRDVEERLGAHRRHRSQGRARLHVHPRPQEGHDRLRRLQHLSARGRGRAVAACGRRDGRGRRHPRREMGRGRHRCRRAARRRKT